MQFRPFEAANGSSALTQFKTWMAKGHSPLTELAMVGWINASLAYDGLLAAGPHFDRAKVLAATNAMSHFTADGLIPPIKWADAHTPYTQATQSTVKDPECSAVVKVVNGQFQNVAPKDKPWLCWNEHQLGPTRPHRVQLTWWPGPTRCCSAPRSARTS